MLFMLSNRSYLYGLLARVYAQEPDQQLVDVLRLEHTRQELGLIGHEFTQPILDAYEGILESLREADIPQLRDGYTRIFVGPGTCKAYPWETVHLSNTKALFQRELLPIREMYRAAGFLPARYPHVQDDFIGLELDFLAKLADAALRACEAGDTQAVDLRLGQSRAFLSEHLLVWLGSLANAIRSEYGDGFYARFTMLALLVAQRDYEVLL